MRVFGLLGIAGALMLVADVAAAEVQTIQRAKGGRSYPPAEYVPMYPGDNALRLRGPGVQKATAIHLPPGVADAVRLQGKDIDATGLGELMAFIRVKSMVHGKVTVRVAYPGLKPGETFNARVFRRGLVHTISAPTSAKVGEPLQVRYAGQDFGVAALLNGGPLYAVERVGGSNDSAQFHITFKQCGTLRLAAGLLHDAQVPAAEVLSGEASYLGNVKTTVVVGPAAGERCPAATAIPSQVPFCPVGKRWDDRKSTCI